VRTRGRLEGRDSIARSSELRDDHFAARRLALGMLDELLTGDTFSPHQHLIEGFRRRDGHTLAASAEAEEKHKRKFFHVLL
jgi:hypothetical protein